MKMIVGLGNPGKEYDNTRHNIGFIALDNLLSGIKWKKKFNSLFLPVEINNEKILFVKPQTYMNLSGYSVAKFVKFYKIKTENILIIQDDLDLAFGKIKIKTDSGAGGHNGIDSIISALKTKQINRLKIGIGNNKNIETKDYVLGKFTKTEEKELPNILEKTKELIETFCESDINAVMNKIALEDSNELS